MAETIDPDKESWAEVQVTLGLTAITSTIFIAVFETARRNPAITQVFDRRRYTKPHRTPAPLLRKSLLEWLFLSNEPRYSEFSDLAHMRDVISERRKQRQKKSRKFPKSHSTKSLKSKGVSVVDSVASPHDEYDSDDDYNSKPSNSNPALKPSDTFIPKIAHHSDDEESMEDVEIHATGAVEVVASERSSRGPLKIKQSSHLTPNVVEISGRRLPKEVAEWAIANDLSNEQLDQYESALIQQEKNDEAEFFRRVKAMKLRYRQTGNVMDDLRLAQDEEHLSEEYVDNRKLALPHRPSRLRYLNFQQGALTGRSNVQSSPRVKALSPRSFFKKIWSNANLKSHASHTTPHSVTQGFDDDVYMNRHLQTTINEKRPLTQSDLELLRCVGLDTFVMLRFLRFCFDVTFYPFLVSLMILMPTYYTNNFNGVVFDNDFIIETQTNGYFRFTMNRLETNSAKIWVPFGYTLLLVLFMLRRHWLEWETFITLRFDFLANGDVENEHKKEIEGSFSFKSRLLSNKKDMVQLHLDQYRNSCIVEFIPESHRRDIDLFNFFDSLFPGQVKRAEVVLNASKLAKLVKERQTLIELYETVYAKHQYQQKQYVMRRDGIIVDKCGLMYCLKCKWFKKEPNRPLDPTLTVNKKFLCCCGRKVKALPHLLSEIRRLNREADREFEKISATKDEVEDEERKKFNFDANPAHYLKGIGSDLKSDTGFVEFTNLTAKQSALQCNLTGTNNHFVTGSAPDPRDMLWENATVKKSFINVKRLQCNFLFFVGTLFWAGVVSLFTAVADIDRLPTIIPSFKVPEEDSLLYVAIEGYLPVVILELIMLPVPIIIRIIATRFIRFKTHSEIDSYVYQWHFAYRVANLIIIIVRHQVLKTFKSILLSPTVTIGTLTASLAYSSQFFLNNMLLAAGTETLFELSQLPRIISHFMIHRFVTIEATSRRRMEKLKEAISLEWGDIIPKFIFALLIAAVYSSVVPIVSGACALFFYVATKVYTHQALFVYAQPYEGGGKLMYQLNRSVLSVVYTTVNVFAVLLALKKERVTAIVFAIVMNALTILIDREIKKKFITPGLTLALTNARMIDEQNKLDEDRVRQYREYRRAKITKRRKEAQSKFVESKTEKPSLSKVGRSSSILLGARKTDDSPIKIRPNVKRTRFNATADKSVAGKSIAALEDDSDSDDSMENDQDFYLYRQPELNKSIWETKPRSYM